MRSQFNGRAGGRRRWRGDNKGFILGRCIPFHKTFVSGWPFCILDFNVLIFRGQDQQHFGIDFAGSQLSTVYCLSSLFLGYIAMAGIH